MPSGIPLMERRMGRSGKKAENPKEDLQRNRRRIQSCESQITANNLLIQRYEEQYDVLRSAIGNLDTVISNIEGIQRYAYHVFNSCNDHAVEWRGQEYRYTDNMVFDIDTDMSRYKQSVETLQEELESRRDWIREEINRLASENWTLHNSIAYLQMQNRALRLIT